MCISMICFYSTGIKLLRYDLRFSTWDSQRRLVFAVIRMYLFCRLIFLFCYTPPVVFLYSATQPRLYFYLLLHNPGCISIFCYIPPVVFLSSATHPRLYFYLIITVDFISEISCRFQMAIKYQGSDNFVATGFTRSYKIGKKHPIMFEIFLE